MSRVSDKLVNQVITRFTLQASANSQTAPKLTQNPSITIARDPGSGGKPIASSVADKLSFEFYDEALVEAIAKSVRKRKKIIKQVDEKTRTVIQDIVHSLFNPEYISETTYINHLTSTVLSIAYTGNAVILGRGANLIIPQGESLQVLVTAPKHVRIKRAVKYEKIDRDEALVRIEKHTEERRKFVSQYFGKSYTNPSYYDLILNTHFYDIGSASEVIIAAFRKKFPTFTDRLKTVIKKTGNLY